MAFVGNTTNEERKSELRRVVGGKSVNNNVDRDTLQKPQQRISLPTATFIA